MANWKRKYKRNKRKLNYSEMADAITKVNELNKVFNMFKDPSQIYIGADDNGEKVNTAQDAIEQIKQLKNYSFELYYKGKIIDPLRIKIKTREPVLLKTHRKEYCEFFQEFFSKHDDVIDPNVRDKIEDLTISNHYEHIREYSLFDYIVRDRSLRQNWEMADRPPFIVLTLSNKNNKQVNRLEFYAGHDKLRKIIDIKSFSMRSYKDSLCNDLEYDRTTEILDGLMNISDSLDRNLLNEAFEYCKDQQVLQHSVSFMDYYEFFYLEKIIGRCMIEL